MTDKYTFKDDKNKEPYHLLEEFVVREIYRKESKYVWANLIKEKGSIYSLGNSEIIEFIKDALVYGINKYGKKDSWKSIESAQSRYLGAYERHARSIGIDKESGLSHICLMFCNMYFLLYFEMMEN